MGHFRPLALITGALLALAALCAPAWAAGLSFPALSGRVVDAANIIPPDEKARLDQKLAGLEAQSHRQLVVATVPDLQGYEISDYGYQLGRAWGIGNKESNDGVLLIVAPKEHKVRIEVGYGLEGVLTDGLSSLIIQNTIVPKFKAGDLPGGVEAGTDALIHQLTLPDDQARQNAQQQPVQARPQDESSWVPGAFFIAMFLFVFILPSVLRSRQGMGYRTGGVGQMILWGALNSLASGRGSSGGSGFGDGGGFSGGGGSFGGGGASGSW